MRTHLYTSLGALKVGMDILLKEEHVQIDKILGHGGLFKTKGVGVFRHLINFKTLGQNPKALFHVKQIFKYCHLRFIFQINCDRINEYNLRKEFRFS